MNIFLLVILNDSEESNQEKLRENISFFKAEIVRLALQNIFIESNSTIHCCVISGNEKTKEIATKIEENGFAVKAILSPTVSVGEERLRFCLHSYNSTNEITKILENLSMFVNK